MESATRKYANAIAKRNPEHLYSENCIKVRSNDVLTPLRIRIAFFPHHNYAPCTAKCSILPWRKLTVTESIFFLTNSH